MNKFLIGLIVLLSIIVIVLAINYRGERITNREAKQEKKEYLKAIDSLGTENLLHRSEANRSKALLRLSEDDKLKVYHQAEKREAALQSKIKNLTKEQVVDIINSVGKDSLHTAGLILKGLEYDSLKKDYDKLSNLMQFREIEFKNIVNNQDSMIINLNEIVRLNNDHMAGLENQIKILKKKQRAKARQRNIAIAGGIGLLILIAK